MVTGERLAEMSCLLAPPDSSPSLGVLMMKCSAVLLLYNNTPSWTLLLEAAAPTRGTYRDTTHHTTPHYTTLYHTTGPEHNVIHSAPSLRERVGSVC